MGFSPCHSHRGVSLVLHTSDLSLHIRRWKGWGALKRLFQRAQIITGTRASLLRWKLKPDRKLFNFNKIPKPTLLRRTKKSYLILLLPPVFDGFFVLSRPCPLWTVTEGHPLFYRASGLCRTSGSLITATEQQRKHKRLKYDTLCV